MSGKKRSRLIGDQPRCLEGKATSNFCLNLVCSSQRKMNKNGMTSNRKKNPRFSQVNPRKVSKVNQETENQLSISISTLSAFRS